MIKTSELRDVMKMIVENVIQHKALTCVKVGRLVSVDPVAFSFGKGLHHVSDPFLVLPTNVFFEEVDIGTKHAFIRNAGGQSFFYLYKVGDSVDSDNEHR